MKELQITKDQLSKAYLSNITESIVSRVKDGEYSALDTYLQLKAYEKVISECIKEIQHGAITEAEEYAQPERIKFGVEFEVTRGRTYYDYDSDTEYKTLSEKLKARKNLLTEAAKGKPKGVVLFDEETGEKIEPPPMKENSTAEGITIKFK